MPIPFCIQCTLPESHCICESAPNLTFPSQVSVLFHPRELERRNSTGRLLKRCCHIESHTWHRLKNEQLSQKFQDFALIYPEEESSQPCSSQSAPSENAVKGYLWIDATWQESKKMLRQSPWLNLLPKYSLKATSSQYLLRRNQTSEGLSTMESMALWLAEQNQTKSSQDLLHFFQLFQDRFLTARNAGLFK